MDRLGRHLAGPFRGQGSQNLASLFSKNGQTLCHRGFNTPTWSSTGSRRLLGAQLLDGQSQSIQELSKLKVQDLPIGACTGLIGEVGGTGLRGCLTLLGLTLGNFCKFSKPFNRLEVSSKYTKDCGQQGVCWQKFREVRMQDAQWHSEVGMPTCGHASQLWVPKRICRHECQ
eukprot:1161555-Pelagomonas_calceolata.AAC.4